MKKVFLYLLIISMIAVFSLAGCKAEAAEEVVEELVEEPAVEEFTGEPEEEALDELESGELVEETTTEGKITFTSNRDGNYEIYIIDGSGVTRLTNNQADECNSCFSSDGSKIAFGSNRDGNEEIYIMNVDGSGQKNLTNNLALDILPYFSP